MILPPVIGRELRTALRRKGGTKSRFRVALRASIAAGLFLLLSYLAGGAFTGRSLYVIFFYIGLYLAVAPPARLCVGLFSEERRNQTLELLYLTGMTSTELFVGKLAGAALVASSDLLALAPVMAVPFLLGGLSLNLYLAAIVCLPTVFLFCLAAGVLASVLVTDDGVAFVLMWLFVAVINLAIPIPYYLGMALASVPPFSSQWLSLSPAYAPYLAATDLGAGGLPQFWLATAAAFAWSILCLMLAGFFLSRNWRRDMERNAAAGWRGWLGGWVRGGGSWRAALRRKILPVNPFQWLVQQDRRLALVGWAAIGSICLVWLMGWRAWPREWPCNASLFLTAGALITVVNYMMMFAAARRLGADRRDGILELLLTTPSSPEEMVDGEAAALEAAFRPLRRTVLVLLLLMMACGFSVRSWNTFAAITYVFIWGALCAWCLQSPKGRIFKAMWAALNTGRPVYSVFRWRGGRWTWVWTFYNGHILVNNFISGGASSFPSGSPLEFAFVASIAVPAAAFYYLGRSVKADLDNEMRRRLIMDMRLIAPEPLPDPDDPIFKDWDGAHRLRHQAGASQIFGSWPAFLDGNAPATSPPGDDSGLTRQGAETRVSVPADALALFQLLDARGVEYLVTGGLAKNGCLGERGIKDVDLLMSGKVASNIRDWHVQAKTESFICAQFRTICVAVYLTENPFFDAVRREFAANVCIAGKAVPSVGVGGLIAIDLYAIHLLSRQREFYRNERYEADIIALLASCPTPVEPILALLRSEIPEQHQRTLEDTLETCSEEAGHWRKRAASKSPLRALQGWV